MLNFGNFLDIFAIFRHLMSVIEFPMIVLEVFWLVEYNVYKIDRHNSESNVSMCAWNKLNFEDLGNKSWSRTFPQIILKF